MPTRRHLMHAALSVALGGAARPAFAAGTVIPVRVWPEALPAFTCLSHRVERLSRGGVRLAASTAASTPAAFGGLAFAPTSPGPALELFAGFPFGMGVRELGLWVASPGGRALWAEGWAGRGLQALPCRVLAAPGVVLAGRPISAVEDLVGIGLVGREGGVGGAAWRRFGASGDGAAALAPCRGDAHTRLDDPARVARTLSPPFGVLLDLAFPSGWLASLDPGIAGWIALACGLELAASTADAIGMEAGGMEAGPPPLPAAVLTALAGATAAALRERVPAHAAADYAAARLRAWQAPSALDAAGPVTA